MMSNSYLGEDYVPYFGEADPSVSFMGKAGSFIDEAQNGILFNFSITSTYTTDKTVVLFPAYFNTLLVKGAAATVAPVVNFTNPAEIVAAGYPCDAVADDGVILTDGSSQSITISAGRNTMKFRDMLRFVRRNPTNIVKQEISAGDTSDLKFIISKYEVNPFIKPQESYLNTDKYLLTTNLQDKKLVINDEVLQVDDQALILFNLKAGAELNWTLYIGAVQNDAAFFATKAQVAKANIASAPLSMVKQAR